MPGELTPVLGHPLRATGPANLPETPLVPGVSKSRLRCLLMMPPFLEHIEFPLHNQKEQLHPLPRHRLRLQQTASKGARGRPRGSLRETERAGRGRGGHRAVARRGGRSLPLAARGAQSGPVGGFRRSGAWEGGLFKPEEPQGRDAKPDAFRIHRQLKDTVSETSPACCPGSAAGSPSPSPESTPIPHSCFSVFLRLVQSCRDPFQTSLNTLTSLFPLPLPGLSRSSCRPGSPRAASWPSSASHGSSPIATETGPS